MDRKNSTIKLEAGRSCCTDITGIANFIFMLEIGEHFLVVDGSPSSYPVRAGRVGLTTTASSQYFFICPVSRSEQDRCCGRELKPGLARCGDGFYKSILFCGD